MLIAGGLILGGPAFSFTFADQAIAQMMGNGGIMGMQSMMITQGQTRFRAACYPDDA